MNPDLSDKIKINHGYSLFILLDSHIPQHLNTNKLMVNFHKKAFKNNSILLLNAPSLLVLENEIYKNNLKFDLYHILKTANESEAIGYSNYKGLEGVKIYSLVSDTSKNILHDIYEKIVSFSDSKLDDLLAQDSLIERLVWVDLSLVLKNSKRNKESNNQNTIIRFVLFHYFLLKYFLDYHEKNIHSLFNNSIYSLNQAAVSCIRKTRPDVTTRYFAPFHEGHMISRFKIMEHPTKDAFYRRKFFVNYQDKDLMKKAFSFTKKFLAANVFGTSPFKYSPEVSEISELTAYSALGLDPKKQIYVYFTSSPDEELVSDIMCKGLYANNTIPRRPYSDEVEAIRILAERASSLGLNLIVRFHPRLDVESRVPLQSDNYQDFLESVEKIKEGNSYVHIIYANQPISSYWLAGWADRIFSVRSSMGNVLPLLGLPVVMMSDNRGSCVAGFESLIMKERYAFPSEHVGINFDIDKLVNIICGFYVTNCHASFGVDDINDDRNVDLYRNSVDTGFSSIAFISNPSADFYESPSIDDALPLLNEYLIYLLKNLKQISNRQDFPNVKVCSDLLEKLSAEL